MAYGIQAFFPTLCYKNSGSIISKIRTLLQTLDIEHSVTTRRSSQVLSI